MAQGQHTPGPWKLVKRETTFDIVGADSVRVLKTSWHSSIRDPYPLKDEAWRNALLATAAPEMLEALRSINKVASPNPQRTFDDVIRDLGYITACARSAIAKADPSTRRDGPVRREGV